MYVFENMWMPFITSDLLKQHVITFGLAPLIFFPANFLAYF